MNTTDAKSAAPDMGVGTGALLAEAAHSTMTIEHAMQLAEDFCKHEAWGLDFWREPVAVLAAEVAKLRSANVKYEPRLEPTQ